MDETSKIKTGIPDPLQPYRREVRDRVAGDMFARWATAPEGGESTAPSQIEDDRVAIRQAAACVRLATILAEALYPVPVMEATNAGK